MLRILRYFFSGHTIVHPAAAVTLSVGCPQRCSRGWRDDCCEVGSNATAKADEPFPGGEWRSNPHTTHPHFRFTSTTRLIIPIFHTHTSSFLSCHDGLVVNTIGHIERAFPDYAHCCARSMMFSCVQARERSST